MEDSSGEHKPTKREAVSDNLEATQDEGGGVAVAPLASGDDVNRRFQLLEAKMIRLDQQRGAEIEKLKQSSSGKGVTTQADFFNAMTKDGLLEETTLQSKVWAPSEPWPFVDVAKAPKENADEAGTEGVQRLVSGYLERLRDHALDDVNPGRWVSLPDPEAYNWFSFRSRKPDVVNYRKDFSGSLAITSFGKLKKMYCWEGTLGFSMGPKEIERNKMLSPAARDLVSVVRTAYSLLFHESPLANEDDAMKFWEETLRIGTVWEEAMNHAKQLKYDDLAKLLERLK